MTQSDEIYALTALHLRQEEERAARLASEVDAMRERIAAIDQMMAQAFNPDPTLGYAPQQLGADALWHAHMSRERAQVVTALASLRARQEAQKQDLAQAFGRNEAAAALAQQDRTQARRHAQKKSSEAFQQMMLMSAARRKQAAAG